MTSFIDAYRRADGLVQVAVWDDIDAQEAPSERRTMTPEAFLDEYPTTPLQEGLFA